LSSLLLSALLLLLMLSTGIKTSWKC
jgi:hypothetical protein